MEKSASFCILNPMSFSNHLNDSCAMDLERSLLSCIHIKASRLSENVLVLFMPCITQKAQMKRGWEKMKEIDEAVNFTLSVNIQLPDTRYHSDLVQLYHNIDFHIVVRCYGFPPSLPLTLSFSCCPQSCADCLTPTLHSSVLTSHTISFPSVFSPPT